MITEALFCLALTVYHEARSQPLIEQLAVAQVVLNRVNSPHFPNTVCAVVHENRFPNELHKCQFSFMCDGLLETYPDTDAWIQSNQIASLVLSPALPDLVEKATHYHADYVNPYWSKSLDLIATIGSHKFYR
jgi:spore germination cell wall hydrolase CwlJ-like protein